MESDSLNELDIINRTRGEVMTRKDVTGENLFLVWGTLRLQCLYLNFCAAAMA